HNCQITPTKILIYRPVNTVSQCVFSAPQMPTERQIRLAFASPQTIHPPAIHASVGSMSLENDENVLPSRPFCQPSTSSKRSGFSGSTSVTTKRPKTDALPLEEYANDTSGERPFNNDSLMSDGMTLTLAKDCGTENDLSTSAAEFEEEPSISTNPHP
ncbi:unnamed protein product, partial [Didymodactylos carnosus]